MSLNPQPPPPTPPPHASSAGAAATPAAAAVCTNCCSDDRWVLLNTRFRGMCRKLCPSCVLKLHPTSFCPSCFSIHEPTSINAAIPTTSMSNGKTLTCFKCSSVSHSTCVPPNAPRSPYLCPLCSNPSFKFFDIRKPTKNNNQSDDGHGSNSAVPEDGQKPPSPVVQKLDLRLAKVLFAATSIAAISMKRAEAVARLEAEKRVRDSALARRRAKESIDHVTAVSALLGVNSGSRETEVSARTVALNGAVVAPGKRERNGGIERANTVAAAAVKPPDNKNVNRSNPNNQPVGVPVA